MPKAPWQGFGETILSWKRLTARRCPYCNKCLLNNVLENPLGCYYERRYGGDRTKIVQEV